MTKKGTSKRKVENGNGNKVLGTIDSASLAELMSLWRGRDPAEWSRSVELYRRVGERILGQGEPLLAYDVIREGLNIWPADVRLRQLQGLALARSGATQRANTVLETLRDEGQSDEETLGMLGRTYKDLAASASTASHRHELLERAAETYGASYRAIPGYWTGINAATMNLLVGQKELACEIASKVRDQCLEEVQASRGDQYWELAVLGEAALICRDLSQAQEWYERAAKQGRGRFGDLQSSRRNARLILQHWNEDPNWVDKYLGIPSIVVFAGHMIDRPGRTPPRFPSELEAAVAGEICRKIDQLRPGLGFSSAACGSDILFLEAMLESGAEVSIVLPYSEEEFIRDSVDFVPNSNWRARFERVLARAARVVTASTQHLEIGGVSYEFCNHLLLGLATIQARQLDTTVIPLTVWNEKPGDGPGGAASVTEVWRDLGYAPEIINIDKVRLANQKRGAPDPTTSDRPPKQKVGAVAAATASASPTSFTNDEAFKSRIVAILFADAVGFSKLTEPEVPRFVQHFLGAIAQLTDKFQNAIIGKNTWGDGLYLIFSDVDAAGNFALQLAELAGKTNWEAKGIHSGLNMRIALHAGPVYEFNDPITQKTNYSGTHVSRAARLEPITPPGQVYASESFAALTAARLAAGFACEYVGQIPMAKGYGTLPAYHVRPSTSR